MTRHHSQAAPLSFSGPNFPASPVPTLPWLQAGEVAFSRAGATSAALSLLIPHPVTLQSRENEQLLLAKAGKTRG